ncbi:Type I restriction-modification system specificity subunit S [Lactococcus lactis subsp. lactis]|uniref:Type I restriction-modification system specificity subunit S n=1 Tax=Lactococcus lactis subsp. lactis TaxID=1360 RepID=A0A0V8DMZ1_LACLL|nr:restriction endonuclease subunit S [Lactococcus lactis]KSU15046.1 Type I restriction-modification system specificity subunit S [Lactococcus lactis subsp. lactis]
MAKIDDSVKKKVPELRFKGFTDDWEERKFADFIDVKSGKDYKHLNSGSIPVYGTGGYMLSVDRALSDIDAIGIGRKGTIDKPYLLKAPFWTVDTLFYAVPKQNIDLQFSLSIFKKINWKKFDESTGVPSLSKTVINSVGAFVPSYEEQQKIGAFFKQLDNTITLHQRKLDLLKEQKKGYLQKMFPKNGAKVPELRFAGFADDWEERKLEKVFDTITDYVANGSFESLRKNVNSSDINGFAYLVRLQDASNNWQGPWLYTDQHGYEFLKKSRLQPDDIIMANVGSVGKFFLVPKLDKPMTLAPNAVLIKSSENDQGFLYQMMLTPEMQYKIFEKTTPGVQSKINKTDFKMIETRLPNMDEQKKIGAFFKQLDDTIALHQRKLDLLKEQKKGFLQKMFV